MRLFCADIRGLDPAHARLPGRTAAPGSAFAWSLLGYAARELWGAQILPAVGTRPGGAPFFPERPEWCFSLSHTRTHVLCAVSDSPVGADAEFRRERLPEHAEKLATAEELESFDFWELWTLRESFFKLTGRGSLRRSRFSRGEGGIIAPEPGVICRLYRDVPGCAAAVCAFSPELPERVEFVTGRAILNS